MGWTWRGGLAAGLVKGFPWLPPESFGRAPFPGSEASRLPLSAGSVAVAWPCPPCCRLWAKVSVASTLWSGEGEGLACV